MKKMIFCLFVLIFINNTIDAQYRTISGKVIYDELEPISYATIYINDSIEIGKSDSSGIFQVEVPINLNRITVRSIGLEKAVISISEECNYVELIMIPDGTYCFMSFRKINKIRKKRYDNLPKLHIEAFEKGIFNYPDICYTHEFIPYGPVNKK